MEKPKFESRIIGARPFCLFVCFVQRVITGVNSMNFTLSPFDLFSSKEKKKLKKIKKEKAPEKCFLRTRY